MLRMMLSTLMMNLSKNEDYTKRDTIKNAFFTKITEILMNKEYGFYFVENQN